MKRWLWRMYADDRLLQLGLVAFMAVWCGFLLSQSPGVHGRLTLTFNSMAANLLQWRFDVDPATVGLEGFLRNGKIYSYWGIWCALLRLPLVLLHRPDADMTVVSCTLGVCMMGWMKVRTVLLLRRGAMQTAASRIAVSLTLLYVVLGGAQIGYLKSSIFQEIVFWAAAFGAMFVYFFMRGVVEGRFTSTTLCWLALSAGLALLTRVSTGFGLCLASGLLVASLLRERRRSGMQNLSLALREMFWPLAVLAVLLIAVGVVNYGRWGSPLTFADHTKYLYNQIYTDRMPRTRLYGYFNLQRIPFGLVYYFLPVWVLHAPGGGLVLGAMSTRLIDAVELPPSSFLLTDAFALAMAALLIAAWRTTAAKRWLPRRELAAVATGLAAPCLLMLTAISMNYRYRMEFYPLFDLMMFSALYLALRDEVIQRRFLRAPQWMVAAAAVSVVTAFFAMIAYKMSPFGPAQPFLHDGIVRCYIKLASP